MSTLPHKHVLQAFILIAGYFLFVTVIYYFVQYDTPPNLSLL